MASRTPKRTGFKPIEVTPGRTTPPLVREVDFSAPAEKPKQPARPAKQKES